MFKRDSFIKLGQQMCPEALQKIAESARKENEWHTLGSVKYAAEAIKTNFLDPLNLDRWLSKYSSNNLSPQRKVGIIMAGNIPFAGFFDLMCATISHCDTYVKYSSKDRVLMEWIVSLLADIDSTISISPLEDNTLLHGLIASGGNSAANAIASKYGFIPTLIRGHRTSVAIISGAETSKELEALWYDIFTYYTLGCRNVTHLYLPKCYNPKTLVELWNNKLMLSIHHKGYLANYSQSRAMANMLNLPYIDGGYFLFVEQEQSNSLAEISYSFYSSTEDLNAKIAASQSVTQCVVSSCNDKPDGPELAIPSIVRFGQAQQPQLSDYPDFIDVISFIQSLHI